MPNRVSIDQGNISLNDLFKEAETWDAQGAKDLTNDQIAILNLKRVIELKDKAGGIGGGKECFICATGA
jgi:hypothetical protein